MTQAETKTTNCVELPQDSTFTDIIKQVDTNKTIGYKHLLKIGNRCVIAYRKFTWSGNVAKTSYLHIIHVNNFNDKNIINYWREQKNGNFKTV